MGIYPFDAKDGAIEIQVTNAAGDSTWSITVDVAGGLTINVNDEVIPRFRIDENGDLLVSGTVTGLG